MGGTLGWSTLFMLFFFCCENYLNLPFLSIVFFNIRRASSFNCPSLYFETMHTCDLWLIDVTSLLVIALCKWVNVLFIALFLLSLPYLTWFSRMHSFWTCLWLTCPELGLLIQNYLSYFREYLGIGWSKDSFIIKHVYKQIWS